MHATEIQAMAVQKIRPLLVPRSVDICVKIQDMRTVTDNRPMWDGGGSNKLIPSCIDAQENRECFYATILRIFAAWLEGKPQPSRGRENADWLITFLLDSVIELVVYSYMRPARPAGS